MYQIKFSRLARKAVIKFAPNLFEQLINDFAVLKNDPRPNGCIKLTDRDGYRLRSGNYRILYAINDDEKIVYIAAILHRKDAYKDVNL